MTTVWDYSDETEAFRLLHAARQTAVGFYKANHFIVLPKPQEPATGTVYLPDLPYLSIPRFWDQAKKVNVDTMPIKATSSLISQAKHLLATANLPTPNLTKLARLWSKHQDQIITQIYALIPAKKDCIAKIIIQPTAFGTGCSFSLCGLKGRQSEDLYVWLRDGASIYTIVEAILTSLTRADVYNTLDGVWAESEIIVDWLMVYSPLSKLLASIDPTARYLPTIKTARAVQKASLLQETEEFMKKIGAPIIDTSTIKSVDTSGFTQREKKLLDLLITRSPQVVTFDEIFSMLYSSDEDRFSLYAIAKSIQRLRDRLESHGISGSFIQTKRGEGYLLAN